MRSKRIIMLASVMLVALMAWGTLGVSAGTAWRSLGWSRDRTQTFTFKDRSPRATLVALDMWKRGKQGKCEARVSVQRARYSTVRYGPYTRWNRGSGKRIFMRTSWTASNRKAADVRVTVRTNGRCTYRVWAR